MRLASISKQRLSAAAKYLTRTGPHVGHSAALEALSQAIGYRDFHEFSQLAPSDGPPARVEPNAAVVIVRALSERLGLCDGDVQFCLDRAGLFGPWTRDDHIAARSAAWQLRFGSPTRGQPRALVKAGVDRRRMKPAYLLRQDHASLIYFDTGFGTYANFEVVSPRTPIAPFVPLRLWLPYGYWTLADGSEVIFSRDYLPMWRISTAGVERLSPWLWIKDFRTQNWIAGEHNTHKWSSPEVVATALEYLDVRRIRSLPRLADILPEFINQSDEGVGPALSQLYHRSGRHEEIPPFAVLNRRKLESSI